MSLSGLLLFASVYLVAVATPGPGVALVIARALGRGLDGLGWFIAGFLIGDIVLMTLALSGLAFIAQTYALAFEIIKYVGVAYLLWMAWHIWRAPIEQVEIDPEVIRERPWRALLSSLSLTLGNPKAIFFFLSIMPLVLDVGAIGLGAYAALVAIMVVVLPPVLATYAFLADRARKVFRSARALRRINKGTAVVMASAAAVIAKS